MPPPARNSEEPQNDHTAPQDLTSHALSRKSRKGTVHT